MISFYGEKFQSRLLMGTARFPSPEVLHASIKSAEVDVVTVSLRREAAGSNKGQRFWEMLKELNVLILPNTAGCYSVREAVTTAHLARELFDTTWIKLEVIADDKTLAPHEAGTLEAAKILLGEGFSVFPYMTDSLQLAEGLAKAGCQVLMPWGSPIGSGQGIINPTALLALRKNFPELTLIVDAGIGKPSHACLAMELGYDGVLVNTALALALDPVAMGRAFSEAVKAGALAKVAGTMAPRDVAEPSTPSLGKPFWQV